eukprot:NODE_275_length_10988_cov_0.409863.p8 type:complete len:142 gc:universal NODE_275_length_10988_cov_0.409863:9687-10112(+)
MATLELKTWAELWALENSQRQSLVTWTNKLQKTILFLILRWNVFVTISCYRLFRRFYSRFLLRWLIFGNSGRFFLWLRFRFIFILRSRLIFMLRLTLRLVFMLRLWFIFIFRSSLRSGVLITSEWCISVLVLSRRTLRISW